MKYNGIKTYKQFGKRLKYLREQKGLTQQELADKVKIHQVSIANYERGIRKPNEENMKKFAKLFKIDPVDLEIGEVEVIKEDTPYGMDINIKYVSGKKYGKPELSPAYDTLSDNEKFIVNELINELANKSDI